MLYGIHHDATKTLHLSPTLPNNTLNPLERWCSGSIPDKYRMNRCCCTTGDVPDDSSSRYRSEYTVCPGQQTRHQRGMRGTHCRRYSTVGFPGFYVGPWKLDTGMTLFLSLQKFIQLAGNEINGWEVVRTGRKSGRSGWPFVSLHKARGLIFGTT